MADSKITALTAISTVDPTADPLVIVDVSDTSMAASGTTKKSTINQLLGSGGTATLASATITGDLTVDTSTLKVDSANNRVGIGTASPGLALDIVGSARVTYGQSYNSFTSGGSNSPMLSCQIWNAVGNIVVLQNPYSDVVIGSSTTGTSTERYRIASDGVATWSNVGGVAGTAMTLNANGLGIGVTPSAWRSTQKALQIGAVGTYFSSAASGGSTCIGRNVYENSAGDFTYIVNDEATFYEQTATGTHAWYTAAAGTGTISFGSAKMTLAASGNLLLGTVTDIAAVRMQVWSSESNNTAYFRNSNATPYGPSIKYTAATPNNTGSEFLYCEDNTALRVALRSNGGIANYQANDVSLSDSRLKTDIKPLASYWNKIKSLELVTFKYKDQTHSDDNIGLIAQQVESVAPELVDIDGFGTTPEDGVPLKTIYTTDLYHAAIKALQEAMTRIEALEAKLA